MFITPFTTRRIQAQMRELTLRQAVDLCEIPEHLNELGIGRVLAAVVAETNLPLNEWTVQERYAALCHYITAQEQGDWAVTDDTLFSDYVLTTDYPEKPVQIGDGLEVVPLTGEYAEACEQAVLGMGRNSVGDWVLAVMAACIRSQGETWEGTPHEFVKENIQRLLDLPESSFAGLQERFQTAFEQLQHGFELQISHDGFAVVPQKGETAFSAVRFRFYSIMQSSTAGLWKTTDLAGAYNRNTSGL